MDIKTRQRYKVSRKLYVKYIGKLKIGEHVSTLVSKLTTQRRVTF
jgi:hypothetical protein